MFYSENIGLTYDDVLIVPNYSEILPSETSLQSFFSKNIPLNIPIASSAMDTVTESKTAIVMAQEGGIGVIHKNLSIEDQAAEVMKVKKYEAGMILDPITVSPETKLHDLNLLRDKYKISGFPVIDSKGCLVGMVTNRDVRFETNMNMLVSEVMTSENLVTGEEGIDFESAKMILHVHRIEKLPIINSEKKLIGLITIRDIKNSIAYPMANKDSLGRLRVAAAVGVGENEFARAKTLIEAGADAILIDTAHGHSKGVLEMLGKIKQFSSQVDVVAGNVATPEGCLALIKAGADGIKVGIGPGSICTTRVVAGVGVPQLQALLDCKEVCHKHKVPYIADGGIKLSGDIVKALVAGASSVMIGSLFAGTDESPGEMVLYQGRAYKIYRGMGSVDAMMKGSKDRYGQGSVVDEAKLVPEGIEGQVPYRGKLSDNIFQLIGGLKSGMGYVGAKTILELKEFGRFIKISAATQKENHPHDITITKEAPNYRLS
jgi:IMP dehydrogenase